MYKTKVKKRGEIHMEHTISKEELKKNLKSNFERGIKEGEAEARLEVYGKNILSQKKKKNILLKFIQQFNDFMIIILMIAAAISAIMAKIDGTGDYVESIIIIAVVVLNSIMGLVQESKAEKSLEALKKMSAPSAKVIRDRRIKRNKRRRRCTRGYNNA